MPASKAQQAKTADRRAKAIALRLAGVDWQTIADRLDYSDRGAACKDVTRALERNLVEEAQQVAVLRQVTVERYDRLQAAYWPKALRGDIKAAEIVLKVLAQRAKIEGTDAPQKVEVLTIDAIDAQIAALREQLAAADGAAGEAGGVEAAPY
ncbi:hypothetical protein ACWDA7_30395 [Streptomyces sp. NPDC001156]